MAVTIPLPPDDLMIAVAGHAIHEDFDRSRRSGPKQMMKDLAAAGVNKDQIHDVLDFGCGSGRFLAGWVMLNSPFNLHGCDYNPLLTAWCKNNIPTVKVETNQLGQPVPFDDNSFDFIYLLSVFTHITIAEQKSLIAEFHRLLRPNGIIYITFHGERYYPMMFPLVRDGAKKFNRDGFLIQHAGVEGSNTCWTIHRIDSIIELFSEFALLKHFRSVDRGPTDVASWQDSLILHKI